jgi:hypothetical protein
MKITQIGDVMTTAVLPAPAAVRPATAGDVDSRAAYAGNRLLRCGLHP